jgi:death-on-curing protein
VKPNFLNVDDVLKIHDRELARFGGLAGLRDAGLLESALAQASATFGGEFLHEDLHAMAAAYLFHIVKNHPFLDGNKRTGFISCMTFMSINKLEIPPASDMWYDIVIAIAEGRIDKDRLTARIHDLASSRG